MIWFISIENLELNDEIVQDLNEILLRSIDYLEAISFKQLTNSDALCSLTSLARCSRIEIEIEIELCDFSAKAFVGLLRLLPNSLRFLELKIVSVQDKEETSFSLPSQLRKISIHSCQFGALTDHLALAISQLPNLLSLSDPNSAISQSDRYFLNRTLKHLRLEYNLDTAKLFNLVPNLEIFNGYNLRYRRSLTVKSRCVKNKY